MPLQAAEARGLSTLRRGWARSILGQAACWAGDPPGAALGQCPLLSEDGISQGSPAGDGGPVNRLWWGEGAEEGKGLDYPTKAPTDTKEGRGLGCVLSDNAGSSGLFFLQGLRLRLSVHQGWAPLLILTPGSLCAWQLCVPTNILPSPAWKSLWRKLCLLLVRAGHASRPAAAAWLRQALPDLASEPQVTL